MPAGRTEKSVSFCEQVRIVRIRNDDYTFWNGTKHHLWYSKEELKMIIKEARHTIRRFENGSQRPSDYLRGLERGTDFGFARSQKIKQHAYDAFFNEHKRQKRLGIHDINALKNAYASVSSRCTQEAIDVALVDSILKDEEVGDVGTGSRDYMCWLFAPPKWCSTRDYWSLQPLWPYGATGTNGSRIHQHQRKLMKIIL
jgi:hypothetical protein